MTRNSMKYLKSLYGTDTRAVQIINFINNCIWFSLLIFSSSNFTKIDIPVKLEEDSLYPLIIILMSMIFSILSFFTKEYKHQLFKLSGLLFGSLVQAIIASAYVSKYPPFEPMLIVCVLLSLWFLGAVIYISNLERLNEYRRN